MDSCVVENEQLTVNNSSSTVENRHLINKYRKTNSNKQTLLINNELTPTEFKIALISACNEFYTEFALNRWNKKAWITLIETFVDETISEGRYVNVPSDKIQGYVYQSLKNMAYKFDLKNGGIEHKFPFYNFLENDTDDEMPY